VDLVNATIPGVVGIILTLKNGKQINIQELLNQDEAGAEATIAEARASLAEDDDQEP